MMPGSKVIAGSECYEIVEELGRGGMGIVYKAIQSSIQRTVAIKILAIPATEDPQLLQRFLREGRLCASLDHPNIVKIFGLVADNNGVPFLVMEYLEGRTLADILSEQKTLDETTFLQVFDQILSALQCAHDKGLVHRDIKPSNIFVTTSGTTKLMDFGIAKSNLSDSTQQGLTRTGAIFGSPGYMSPEQCSGAAVDERTDLYSVGCVMYECLVGSRPYSGDHPLEVMYKHINQQMTTTAEIAIPTHSGIVCKALAKEPDMRYNSADEMRNDLHTGPEKQPQTRRGKSAQFRISRGGIGALLAGALVLSVGIYLIPLAKDNQHHETHSARQLYKLGSNVIYRTYTATSTEGVELRRQALNYFERAVKQAHKENNINLEADALLAQETLRPEAFAKDGESIYKKANSLYVRGNRSAPAHTVSILSLARWYLRHGRPQEAIASAKDALALLRITPAYSLKHIHTQSANVLCAMAYCAVKEYAQADRYFELAIKGASTATHADIRALIHTKTIYASSLRDEQQYQKSSELIKQVIELYNRSEMAIDREQQLAEPDHQAQASYENQRQLLKEDDQRQLVRLNETLFQNDHDLKDQDR